MVDMRVYICPIMDWFCWADKTMLSRFWWSFWSAIWSAVLAADKSSLPSDGGKIDADHGIIDGFCCICFVIAKGVGCSGGLTMLDGFLRVAEMRFEVWPSSVGGDFFVPKADDVGKQGGSCEYN